MLVSPPFHKSQGRVAHLPGVGDDVFAQVLDQARENLVFLDGLLDVDQELALRVGELDLRLGHVDLGPRDSTLVSVVDGHGNGHAEGPRDLAFQAVGGVVLKGIGLPEDDRHR